MATLLIALFAPPLTRMALQFGPAEYFSLMLLGLVTSIALAHGSVVKALAMIVLGLLTRGADNRYGKLIEQLGDRNFLQIKIDPAWHAVGAVAFAQRTDQRIVASALLPR